MEIIGDPEFSDRASPIFIAGMPRSGTTLVSMILNGHSRIAIAPETHYFRKYRRKGDRRNCLSTRSKFETYVDFVLSGPEINDFNLSNEEYNRLRDSIINNDRVSHENVLKSILAIYAQRYSKVIWGDKTPSNIYYIDDIIQIFPNCRILHVIRDPRDIVLSLDKVSWHDGNILHHIYEWKRIIQLGKIAENIYPSNIVSIKYEDILYDPYSTVNNMCQFLHIPFEHTMIEYHKNAEPNFSPDSEPWKEKNLSPIDRNNSMKWMSSLSADKCAIIDDIVGDELLSLGYPTSGYSMSAPARFLWAYLYMENVVLTGRFLAKYAWLRLRNRY